MPKEQKTNVMRILEKEKIVYEAIFYDCDDFIDGITVADKTGRPHEQSFKTLVAQGKSEEYYVFVIPIAEELNLKRAAKTAGEKSIEMIHVKDIQKVTGYIRGGCSPLGMKKKYKTFIHQSAMDYDSIYISGGKLGVTLKVSPKELARIIPAQSSDLIH